MKKIAFFVLPLSLYLLIIARAGAPNPNVFDGDWSNPNRGAPENIFAFQKLTAPFENQTSLWVALFDDGSYFYGYIFNYKFAVIEKWGATGVLIDPDGKRYSGTIEIPPDGLKYSNKSIDFSSKEARMSGRWPEYKFGINAENFVVDLNYKAIVPSFVPGGGATYYDARKKIFLKNFSHCPWAEVSGTIKIGGKIRTVRGQGYADRDHANQIFTKQIKELYTFRAWPQSVDRGCSVSFSEYIGGPQYNGLCALWLTVMKKGEIVLAARDFKLTTSDYKKDAATGYDYPTRWTIEAQSGAASFSGSFGKSKLIDVLDVMNEIPAPLRPIARRFFTRPVFYRVMGEFEGVLKTGSERIPVKADGVFKAVYTK